MKPLSLILTLFALLNLSNFITAQKPYFPKPGDKENIPFGKKQPAPVFNNNANVVNGMYDKKLRDLQPAYFDKENKRIVQNRPGINSAFSFSGATNNKLQPAGKPVNTSANFHLTKDINAQSDGFPQNNPANAHYNFAVLNNVSYFSAEDGIHGRELWRSDGTPAGTYMVKDIYPGLAGSYVDGIVAANGMLYFTAENGNNGYEPWVSDGTEAGTHILNDLVPGSEGSWPSQFVNVNGTVYFIADLYNYHNQLWKTDGTEGGTLLVKDISAEGLGYYCLELTAVNDMAYFIAYTWNSGFQLFRSDGTNAGTYVVKEIGYNGDFTAPMQLTAYDNKLYFSANDGSGRKLWISDGTYDGTTNAPGNNEILLQQDYMNIFANRPFPILNNQLFIAGYSQSDGGGGLYKFDAANGLGEVLVKDLTDIPDFPYDDILDFVVPVDFVIVNNELCFKVISSIGGWHDELWRSNGETDNTRLVKTIGLTDPGAYSYNFTDGNGTLYFNITNEPGIGNELWKSDGTEAGTVLVKDINPGIGDGFPDDLTYCNGRLIFRATDFTNGSEIWQSDGTDAGTSLVKNINVITTNGSDAGFMYKGVSAIGDAVLFNAFTPQLGGELYKSDGTEAGTVLLNDIWTGPNWSFPNGFFYKNKLTYFIDDDAVNTGLYTTNGTAAGLKRITYIDREIYYVVNFSVTDNGQIFYVLGLRNGSGYELWHSDGTEAGTLMLTPNLNYNNNYVVTIGNTGFFVAGDFDHGYELWKSDGTLAGTKLVKDIYPGFGGSYPYSLFAYKNNLYFGAYDGIGFNYSLWKSDGTEKGTARFYNLTPATFYENFADPASPVFCISNQQLYFLATDFNTYGAELWQTNGTAKGTKLVKDINPYSSYPSNLTDVKGTLYFMADDGIHGNELWSTNGTTAGTTLAKDITPDFGGSYLDNFCSAGGKLYFVNRSTYPSALWSSDGTENNTKQIDDAVVSGLSNFSHLTAAGNKLFFGGYNYTYGTELYVGDAGAKTLSAAIVSASKILEPVVNSKFDVAVYPNPAHGNSTLTISGDVKNVNISITDISGKTIWNKAFNDQHTVNMPATKMAAGVYLVTVRNLSSTLGS